LTLRGAMHRNASERAFVTLVPLHSDASEGQGGGSMSHLRRRFVGDGVSLPLRGEGQGGGSMNEKPTLSTVLTVDNVTKVFVEGSQRVEVLRGVSLDVKEGEVVALEGPSGSGKTTLLSIMGCILTPTEGEVTVAGQKVRLTEPAHLRAV